MLARRAACLSVAVDKIVATEKLDRKQESKCVGANELNYLKKKVLLLNVFSFKGVLQLLDASLLHNTWIKML